MTHSASRIFHPRRKQRGIQILSFINYTPLPPLNREDFVESRYGIATPTVSRLAMTKKERNIHYFEVEYAKRGLVLCEGENLSMKECAFTNNETGLKLRGYSDVSVKDCVFKDNVNSGILIEEGISGTIKDDSLYDNGVGINIQALHTFKSPLIPLFQRGNLREGNRRDLVENEYAIASKVNNKGLLAMTPLSRHCEPEGRGNLI